MNTTGLSFRQNWALRANACLSYSVVGSHDVFDQDNVTLAKAARLAPGSRRFVVIDRNVDHIYGDRLRRYFTSCDVLAEIHVMTSNENQKDISSVLSTIDAIEDFKIRRYSDPIIAVGGGVITDTVGVAAQLYRRGTPYIRIPTTLVGIVDAGVGIKVGVNYGNQKNLLGSFYGAESTIIDRSFLTSLPLRQIRCGIAEIIKIAIVCDVDLFALIESHIEHLVRTKFQTAAGTDVIDRAISGMLAQLQPNLWEHDLRRGVDLGHTFGPRLEMDSNGAIFHGESVAIDLAICCGMAMRRGLLDSPSAWRITALLMSAGLPIFHRLCTTSRLLDALEDSLWRRDGMQHIFLPTAIGQGTFVEDIGYDDISDAIRWLRGRLKAGKS